MIMYVQPQEPTIMVAANCLQEQKLSRKRSRSSISRTTSSAAPETKKRRIAKKQVGFRNFVEILPTTSTSTVNDWCNEADAMSFKANIKRDVVYLAKLLKENRVREMDQTEYCTVGIERYCCTPATRAQAKAMKQDRIKAVLQEQIMQKTLGANEPEMIREVAAKYSQHARERALQIADRLVKARKHVSC